MCEKKPGKFLFVDALPACRRACVVSYIVSNIQYPMIDVA
jgi:hypothetical protein